MTHSIYLASASPRRSELLTQIQVPFQVLVEPIDETPRAREQPADYVQRMAREKASAGEARRVREGLPALPVLAADTSVILDNTILGKPRDQAHGLSMLQALGGRQHQVLTAVALLVQGEVTVQLSTTHVWLASIDAALARCYWQTGEPCDKAGGYGIQGLAGALVERLEGSYSGVVGLPLAQTAMLLQRAQIPVWQPTE